MDFQESELERMIRSSVREIAESYGEDYFQEKLREDEFPHEFWLDLGEGGWLGAHIPEEYGGQGLGMQELMTVAEEVIMGGGFATSVELTHLTFGGITLAEHGTEEQKEQWLPKLTTGEVPWSLGVTEPDAGLNTTNISTTAEKDGDEYVINGRKIFISSAGEAARITLLARTTPLDEVEKPSQGLSIFLVDPQDSNVDYDEIPLDIWWPDPTYNVYLDDARVHESQLVGEEGKGLYHIFDTLNTERIVTATTTNSIGRYAIEKAVDYANQREVFDAPISSHQAIQHPLADAYADLENARLMTRKAAWLFDNDLEAGAESNIANLKSSEAAWEACDAAVQTYGGMAASAEMSISKMHQYVRHERIAPVTEQMQRNYIGHHLLGMPKSY
ncbi:MAG: acyl-CoA dehydrogenase family protein [Halobacteriota archaeon]